MARPIGAKVKEIHNRVLLWNPFRTQESVNLPATGSVIPSNTRKEKNTMPKVMAGKSFVPESSKSPYLRIH